MSLDELVLGIIYIVVFFALFYIGKKVYTVLHRGFDLNTELVDKDNPAVSLAVTGYYSGLVLSLGAAVVGPSRGIILDLIDLGLYGMLGIVLLNASIFLCDRIILSRFKIEEELIRDRNLGTGAVLFGISVASGFIIFGSVSGPGGGILTAVVFWILGQILLFIAAQVYGRMLSFDIHAEIEKDNVAAGISFAGALIALGIVVGLAAEGEFVSWADNLSGYLSYALAGLVSLPIIRWLTDVLLLPGVKLSDEIQGFRPDKTIEERGPNIGAAYIEAFSYIAGAFIIYWCI